MPELKVDLSAGADADVETAGPEPGAWLDLFGKLKVSLDGVASQLAQANRREQEALRHVPVTIDLDRQSNPGAAVTDLQDFGGPQPGREWKVRVLSAVAVPLAANAAVVTWYVGQIMPGPAAGMLPPSMVKWQFASVPNFEDFSSVITVKNGEHLIAGLTGIPAASVISLGATIDDQILYDPMLKRS